MTNDPSILKGTHDLLANHSNASDGFKHQTFLGASIIDFNISAGFGDSTSSLSVNLINDEYNKSDEVGFGGGDDPNHNGVADLFRPPNMGSPVFFKFGTKFATVDQAYRKTLDDIYGGYNNASTFAGNDGHFHFAFGGILQAINETKDGNGNPRFSANLVDPREILGNVQLILNNYAGTTFNNKNLYNIYGLLEYNLAENFNDKITVGNLGTQTALEYKDVLTKTDNPNGTVNYWGTDMWYTGGGAELDLQSSLGFGGAVRFPITGTGFSRRSSQGIPYYRVAQGLGALMGINCKLPDIYAAAGFGGYINFRGFNYAVDLSGLPEMDQFYFIDYDKISLLDLILEVCEVTNHEMFVSLLPITSHPSMANFAFLNNAKMAKQEFSSMIHGVIRIDTINRSNPQPPGSIASYLNSLDSSVQVTSKNLGMELSNVNTDKFVVGGNEVEMYYFSANADRSKDDTRTQWSLEKSLEQQILPYYGKLPGNSLRPETVTIPKGFGAYQQILLDASSLNAAGVGNFYVATEIELRAASVSFERWKNFLKDYDSVYMESVEENDLEEGAGIQAKPSDDQPIGLNPAISNNYAVTVPRSVWPTDAEGYDAAGLPLSPCNPPYGYPLYYKRATQIGLPTAGAGRISATAKAGMDRYGSVEKEIENRQKLAEDIELRGNLAEEAENALRSRIEYGKLEDVTIADRRAASYFAKLKDKAKQVVNYLQGLNENVRITHRKRFADAARVHAVTIQSQKKTLANAKKVYQFVKSVADDCLGKKYLVKIPSDVNPFYENNVTMEDGVYLTGPFGFPARTINGDVTTAGTPLSFGTAKGKLSQGVHPFLSYLNQYEYNLFEAEDNYVGGLVVNYNPIESKYQFNYEPATQGGFYEYDLLANFTDGKPLHVAQGLAPQDASVFDLGNNRISAYARFDNSQDLAFNGVSPDSMTQQTNVAGYMMPDLSYSLDNLTQGRPKDFSPNKPRQKQVTFVKVSLDSKFYMPPTSKVSSFGVHARDIIKNYTLSPPAQIYSSSGCDMVDSMQFSMMIASPAPTAPSVSSSIRHFIQGTAFGSPTFQADTNHVYALITLPKRIIPTVDSLLRDGDLQKYNTAHIKHILGCDVVRGVDGFDMPNLAGTPTDIIGDFLLQPIGDSAYAAVRKAREKATFAEPQKMAYISPSPVYPDMVAIPLLSKDRCYGPWTSSQIGGTLDIGGKIEYIKDENLAPWNYSGFDLMNKAGVVQAQFANSLLLQSERGSFSIPTAPSGIALGRSLQSNGPLVSNISVTVGNQGVTTDYSLDLYTASFGKIQKQRLDNISKIGRNQQKLEDERNALIRKGFGKAQTDVSLQVLYDSMMNQVLDITTPQYTATQKGEVPTYKERVMAVKIEKEKEELEGAGYQGAHFRNKKTVTSGTPNDEDLEMGIDSMNDEDKMAENALSASVKDEDKETPVATGPDANLPSQGIPPDPDAVRRLFPKGSSNFAPTNWNKQNVNKIMKGNRQ